MLDLREQLQQLLQSRVCLMGLGNADYGDDGFGVHLAKALAGTEKLETSAESMSPGGSNAAFPLTPALSLREREPHQPALREAEAPRFVARREVILPLPKGESRGEGEGTLEPGPSCKVLITGTTPERFLSHIADQGFDHVIFLDAVEFGGAPGSVVLLNSEEMAARFPQVSTHKLSLSLLASQVETNGRTKAWLLGVQPQSLRQGEPLSPTVQATLGLLLELLKSSSRGNEALTNEAGVLKPALSSTPRFSGVVLRQLNAPTASAVSTVREKPLKRFTPPKRTTNTPLKQGVNATVEVPA